MAQMGLTAVCRTRRYRRWRKGPRAAICNDLRGGGRSHHPELWGLHPPHGLRGSTGQGGRDSTSRCARTPPTPALALAAAPHTCRAGPAPPPALRPRLALAAPPLPTPRGPAHPPHAIHAARAPLGLARPLAVPSGATSNVVSDRAANGLVAPRGRGAPLLTVFPPVRPGARCPWSRLRPRAAYARVPRHSLYALLGHLATLLCVCFLPGSSW